MQHYKYSNEGITIELHNSWAGEETVYYNNQLVSTKSSIMGTNHEFTGMENGKRTAYVLTTKVGEGMQVLVDMTRDGYVIVRDAPVPFGSMKKKIASVEKKKGISKLEKFELEEALVAFEKALTETPNDPDIHFHIACIHSILEREEEGYKSLILALENGLQNMNDILNHELLSYLRVKEGFKKIKSKYFKDYKTI